MWDIQSPPLKPELVSGSFLFKNKLFWTLLCCFPSPLTHRSTCQSRAWRISTAGNREMFLLVMPRAGYGPSTPVTALQLPALTSLMGCMEQMDGSFAPQAFKLGYPPGSRT